VLPNLERPQVREAVPVPVVEEEVGSGSAALTLARWVVNRAPAVALTIARRVVMECSFVEPAARMPPASYTNIRISG
jgi:hypothetical protein